MHFVHFILNLIFLQSNRLRFCSLIFLRSSSVTIWGLAHHPQSESLSSVWLIDFGRFFKSVGILNPGGLPPTIKAACFTYNLYICQIRWISLVIMQAKIIIMNLYGMGFLRPTCTRMVLFLIPSGAVAVLANEYHLYRSLVGKNN